MQLIDLKLLAIGIPAILLILAVIFHKEEH